jgi:hypothetical protein
MRREQDVKEFRIVEAMGFRERGLASLFALSSVPATTTACSPGLDGFSGGSTKPDGDASVTEAADAGPRSDAASLGHSNPDAFSFYSLAEQALGVVVTVTGFPGPLVATVTGDGGPALRVDGGAWGTSVTITAGQTLQVRLTTSGSVNTTSTAAVVAGTTTAKWQVTTLRGSLRMFWTSSSYVGTAIGSLTNADALCQAAAGAAGYAGAFKAVLSDETTDARDRLKLSYPIVRADTGATVAATNLWIGSLNAPLGPFRTNVWTGTDPTGRKVAGSTCASWTGGTMGVVGFNDDASTNWIDVLTEACTNARSLYCIEQ